MEMTKARRLKALIREPKGILVVPGVSDPLAAMLGEQAGFPVLVAPGAGIANLHFGLPDMGLVSLTEAVERARAICRAAQVPVIADADTGFGNAVSVVRTVRLFEEAGAAGLLLEDQVTPKRCGHFEGKQVIDVEEMLQKIRAFCYARRDPDLVLVARTDARAAISLEEALRRAVVYAAAGADMVFVEAPLSREELAAIPPAVKVPTMANMVEGGKTPLCSAAELEQMGYKMVVFANMAIRVAAAAVRDAFRVLRQEGTTAPLLDRMLSWQERQGLVGLPDFQALESFLAGGTPPSGDVRQRL